MQSNSIRQIEMANEPSKELLEIYQKEWEINIQTQMHFNELIIKFRSVMLTAFITLFGAAIAVFKKKGVKNNKITITKRLRLKRFLFITQLPFFCQYRDDLILNSFDL